MGGIEFIEYDQKRVDKLMNSIKQEEEKQKKKSGKGKKEEKKEEKKGDQIEQV